MKFERSSGILLHPTSLPSPDGIGDLGPDAYWWVQALASTQTGLWQILPISPTGYGDSPYQSFSAFAGNPLLISLLLLVESGLLQLSDLDDRPQFDDARVDFGRVIEWKNRVMDQAFERFSGQASHPLQQEFVQFQLNEADWLDDYALFMSIKHQQGGAPWNLWPRPLKARNASALTAFRNQHGHEIDRVKFRQWIFDRQWRDLKEYANNQGIKIIGDIPIFVSHDSADAWANPTLFHFDRDRNPTVVAGVPPDYFSATGQLWGNPLYKWEAHRRSGYDWWIKRMKTTLDKVDIIRLDHFRGFVDYWEIPAGMPTAEIGEWKLGPGRALFDAIERALGELPIIAEDLGLINPEVYVLRDQLELPGMKILQFAFSDDAENDFLPHNYPPNCVAYTGTHDNDTTIGWYATAPETERDYCRRYLNISGEDIAWDLIRAIWASVAGMAIAPMQDILRKDTRARMNYPGQAAGNWNWRLQPGELTDEILENISEINRLYGRQND